MVSCHISINNKSSELPIYKFVELGLKTIRKNTISDYCLNLQISNCKIRSYLLEKIKTINQIYSFNIDSIIPKEIGLAPGDWHDEKKLRAYFKLLCIEEFTLVRIYSIFEAV